MQKEKEPFASPCQASFAFPVAHPDGRPRDSVVSRDAGTSWLPLLPLAGQFSWSFPEAVFVPARALSPVCYPFFPTTDEQRPSILSLEMSTRPPPP